MKLSLNWVKQFTKVTLPVDELVQKIGAQLGEVESVESLGERYAGAVIVKVVDCQMHPNADRLHVCLVDDGGVVKDVERNSDGLVQVVCGAPNVQAGVSVVWLPPGVTVPESFGKQPFVLDARELRGVVSNGMLASPKELALGESHEGLLLLDGDPKPGTSFAAAYELDDHIIEIENKMFTHRPDLFGELGLAREVAGISNEQFVSPDWYKKADLNALKPGATRLPLAIQNKLPELVPRFMAAAFSGVTIKDSPVSLQTSLARVGIRPVNNVVDITNYMMILTGQPLHAYDYDKVAALSGGAAVLAARAPKSGENLTLLNGKTVTPREDDIMIATDKQLIGIGGVMGGADTEVDETTKNVILECATFDMYSVRRTSMSHGLFTDAVTRFNKGQSPLQNPAVFGETARLLHKLAGAELASEVIDDNHLKNTEWVHSPVRVNLEFINARLGLSLDMPFVRSLLEHVEFTVQQESDTLVVTAPFWRTDIEVAEDVVEEVGRLYGYDHLPIELPARTIKPAPRNRLVELKTSIRGILAASGANEVLTYSFVHGNLLEKAGQDVSQSFSLANALSPDLQHYRLSLTPSLLDKIHPNIKAGYDQFALFELGKGHNLSQTGEDGLPMEFEMLDLVYAANDKVAGSGAAYYTAKAYLEQLASRLGVQLEFRPFDKEEGYAVAKPYDHSRSAKVFVAGTDKPLGMVGEYKSAVRRAFKLPKRTAGFGIGLAQLLEAMELSQSSGYVSLPRFPKVTQDITFQIAADRPYSALTTLLEQTLLRPTEANVLSSLKPLGIYQDQADPGHKNVSYRFETASYDKTMTDHEVSLALDQVATVAVKELSATRV